MPPLPPLSCINPALLPTLFLILPLTESGIVQFEGSCDFILEDLQVLAILLISWLLALMNNGVSMEKISWSVQMPLTRPIFGDHLTLVDWCRQLLMAVIAFQQEFLHW